MADEKRVFLAYRAIFDGNNAQIRQPKAILKVVSKHRKSSQSLLRGLGETHVIATLKKLLERKIFESELEAKLAFPDLFTTSPAQDVQHTASEADAAKSEAEALEDIASLEGDREDVMERTVNGEPSTDSNTDRVPKVANGITIPSLYPLYIPYRIQHLVLTRTQRLLEGCCYDFTSQWLPELLEHRQWDCPEAIELNKWTYIVVKRLGKLPSHCFGTLDDPKISLADVLISINKLRHSAVHRLPTTAKGISEMIHSATRFAIVLQDSPCQQQLDELHQELEGKIRALELNKNFLETKLEQEMEDIARKRRELDAKEKLAVATMLKEDKDYGSLVGIVLSQTVNEILDRSKTEEMGNTHKGRGLAQETEEEPEPGPDVNNETTHPVGIDYPLKDATYFGVDSSLTNSEAKPEYHCVSKVQNGIPPSSSGEDGNYSGQNPDTQGNRKLPWVQDETNSPNSLKSATSALGATVDRSVNPTVEGIDREIKRANPGDYTVPQEVHDLLAGIVAREMYTAFSEAVDLKLSTYNFQTGGFTKLSDKRLRRIRRFVRDRTKLDVATHQIELDDMIRVRFATFKAERRPQTNFADKKIKKTKRSVKAPKVLLPGSYNSDSAIPPTTVLALAPHAEAIQTLIASETSSSPSPSPPPAEDYSHPSLAHSELGPSTPSIGPESGTESKIFRLATIGNIDGKERLCSLHIREDGTVEGRLIVNRNDAVPGAAKLPGSICDP